MTVDRDILAQLEAIATQCGDAAGARDERELLPAYEALRRRAALLAQMQGWATREQMADQFPSLIALREIERLDLSLELSALTPVRDLPARVSQLLIELAAWATGVRIAYESFQPGGDG